jgi:hypothetical protein
MVSVYFIDTQKLAWIRIAAGSDMHDGSRCDYCSPNKVMLCTVNVETCQMWHCAVLLCQSAGTPLMYTA